MNPHSFSRRDLLQRAGGGFGALALSAMLEGRGRAASSLNPFAPKVPMQIGGKAKSVIWIFTNGGPSQVDTWDYKPELQKRDGKPLDGFDPKTGFFPGSVGPLMASPFKFAQHGRLRRARTARQPRRAPYNDRRATGLDLDEQHASPHLGRIIGEACE